MQHNLRNSSKKESPTNLKENAVRTTLYELIEAIHEVVQPEEKRLVPEIVIHLLNNYGSICWVR